MNIIENNHWDVCFGDEDHKVEIVRGSKEEVTNYLNSLKAQTWEGGCERIDNYVNNELEEESTTLIFFNYDDEVFAVISLDGFKKKLEDVCTIDDTCNENPIEDFAKKFDLEKGSVTILDEGKEVEIEGYFCQERVYDDELPEGFVKREVRTSDDDDSIYATLEKSVVVNFACTFISNSDELKSRDQQYLVIGDWNYEEPYVPDEEDEGDEAYNNICDRVTDKGCYVVIKEEYRPKIYSGAQFGKKREIIVKSLFMSNDTSSPLKLIDTEDVCWDVNDYCSFLDMKKIMQSLLHTK